MWTFISQHSQGMMLIALVVGFGLWHLLDRFIRPLFISRSKINALTDELIAKHGERAEEIAHIEEDRAWRYSEIVRQGKWRRVRQELQRRRERDQNL